VGRTFKDRSGRPWSVEVSPQSKREWVFRPAEGAEREERVAPAPAHVDDPFEVSDQELQRLLDASRSRYRPRKEPPPGLR
jgi:hypothetical protein